MADYLSIAVTVQAGIAAYPVAGFPGDLCRVALVAVGNQMAGTLFVVVDIWLAVAVAAVPPAVVMVIVAVGGFLHCSNTDTVDTVIAA